MLPSLKSVLIWGGVKYLKSVRGFLSHTLPGVPGVTKAGPGCLCYVEPHWGILGCSRLCLPPAGPFPARNSLSTPGPQLTIWGLNLPTGTQALHAGSSRRPHFLALPGRCRLRKGLPRVGEGSTSEARAGRGGEVGRADPVGKRGMFQPPETVVAVAVQEGARRPRAELGGLHLTGVPPGYWEREQAWGGRHGSGSGGLSGTCCREMSLSPPLGTGTA